VIDQPIDDQLLRDVFVDAAPRATIDYARARQSVTRRATRIRRRRTAGSALAVAAVVAIGSSAWAATQRDPRSVITQSPIVIEPTTIAKSTTTAAPRPTASSSATVPATDPATTVPEFIEVTEPVGDEPAVPETGEAPSAPGPVAPNGSAPSASATAPRRPVTSKPVATTARPATTTSTAPPVQTTPPSDDHHDDAGASGGSSGQQTYTSPGGTAIVSWASNRLTLVSTSPAAGWNVVQSRATSEKISITFGKGASRANIALEIDNGRPKQNKSD
jgi:hypothetical protein